MKKSIKLIMALGIGIILSALTVAFTANITQLPELYSIQNVIVVLTVSVFAGVAIGEQKGVLNTLTVAAIIAEWGLLYRAGYASVKDLMVQFMVKSETESIFTRRPTESTIMEKAFVEFSSVLQRFQKQWTPKGGATFTPEKVALYELKIDVEEYPDELEQTWLGFLADSNLDRKQWPFTKWYQFYLLAKAVEDYEKYEIFNGVPATVVPGTPNASGTNVLGIKKQLNDGHAAGKTMTVTMGAVPTDPVLFVSYIEDMYKNAVGVNEELLAEFDGFNMSKTLERRFKTGMRTKYNMNYNQVDTASIIDTNVLVRGLASHAGSTKIWGTPAVNRVCGVKKPKNETIMQVENIDRKVKWYTDFYKGVGFWHLPFVVQNDVELV